MLWIVFHDIDDRSTLGQVDGLSPMFWSIHDQDECSQLCTEPIQCQDKIALVWEPIEDRETMETVGEMSGLGAIIMQHDPLS